MTLIVTLGLLPAVAQAGTVNVTKVNGIVTFASDTSNTADIITIDWQDPNSSVASDEVFNFTPGAGTTFTNNTGCPLNGAAISCDDDGVSGFNLTLSGGNDVLTLADDDPALTLVRLTDALTVNFGSGDDTLTTLETSGNTRWDDPITASGSSGADTLNGGGSSDTLTPGSGADPVVNGKEGIDTASYADRVNIVFNGTTIPAAAVNVTLDGQANDGTENEGDNIGPGIENLLGGDGGDTLTGDDGANLLRGGDGGDTLTGGAGNDTVNGESGSDSLNGGADDDTLNGSSGDDGLSGSTGNDTLNGGTENDSLSGSSGDDTLNGNDGNDSISGSSGNDTLVGEAGDDTLTPGTETDTVDGGDGLDTVSYATPLCLAGLFGGTCPDPTPVTVSLDGVANDGGAGENDNVGAGIENITGGSAGDTLIGDDGPNTLTGNAGDDVLRGNGGNDTLSGGAGNDALHGDGGNDTLDAGAGDDTLRGGADADIVDGGEGSDTANGGPGPDDLRDGGGSGTDTIDYGDSAAGVRVDLAGGGGMGAADEQDTLQGVFENAAGGAGNDDLNGNGGPNVLAGNAGNDTVDGLAGDDTLSGGDGNDRLDGGEGSDTLVGEAGGDRLEGGAGSDPKLDGGDGPDVITGGPGGTSDADAFFGGQGRDLLTYQTRTVGVTVTLDNVANDGGPNEKDNANADIEGVFGGLGPDTLRLNVPVRLRLILKPIIAPLLRPVLFTGSLTLTTVKPTIISTSFATRAVLGGVVDPGRIVQGNGGNDTIIGTLGNDIISGGAGKDKISGGDGNDAMYGGSGEDEVDAGDGNNRVFGNEGSDLIKTGLGDDFISSIDRFGIDRVICGLGRDTFVRDKLDLVRRTSSCDRSIGTPKGASESEPGEPEPDPPGATPEIPWDAGELCGETGDELCTPVPEDPNAPPISPEETWDIGFGLDDFDSFGAEFDDSFFGYDDSFGELDNPKDLVGATMEIANKGNKITIPKKGKVKNALSVKLLCPKAATRRCVGEMVLSIKPKKGKTKELGAELFRFNKGKTKTLKFKLKSKQLKLIPKGKKGANVRVIVEARDGGDLLFGLDQSVKVTR